VQTLPDLLHQSAGHPLVFVLMAVLLGALHGLEPGHSKTMMAAFIIAINGTVMQAVLLGLSAMISHTAVVSVVALGGQYLGRGLNTGAVEPYFQLASAALVVCIALWMIGRTLRERLAERAFHTRQHDHHHGHADAHTHAHATDLLHDDGYRDAHERGHARQIRHQFKDRHVTNWQIMAFGLTGGLVPCPAAITVLLLCLQLKRLVLGVVLVGCFSIGLAVTMVMAGVIASLGIHQVRMRWSGFDSFARRAPYASGALMLVIALSMAVSGWMGLLRGHA
jgi:nickel/cobalt exporter